MNQIIAMHGWSSNAAVWAPWERAFRAHGWHWISGERGYGSRSAYAPVWSGQSDPAAPQRRAVIAHSLGPHLLEPTVLAQATDVVFLASFGRFVPEGRQGRALRAGLEGMRSAIGGPGEATMLHTFLQRASAPTDVSALPPGPGTQGLTAAGRERLRADLELLTATTGLPPGLPANARVLIVEAGSDAIVAPEASRCLRHELGNLLEQAPEHWCLPNVGHALLVPHLLTQVRQWLGQDQWLGQNQWLGQDIGQPS